jgi:hypothetical protein
VRRYNAQLRSLASAGSPFGAEGLPRHATTGQRKTSGAIPTVISTYQALVVALVAILPGAPYTFPVERLLGSYGVKCSDRLVRFLAGVGRSSTPSFWA